MLFNSYEFIFAYAPIVLIGCFVIAATLGARAAQLWLIAGSLFFYTYWNPAYLPLLLISILFNYGVAVAMTRTTDDRRRVYFLIAAVVVDLGLLGYYKYTGFFFQSLNQVAGTHFPVLAIALPLGISFYTFQQLTLLVDISGGTVKNLRLRDFFLFITFFPHLIAGPIVHHKEMMPQFEKADYRFRWENMAVGITLFAAGLFKKAVLADGITEYVVPLYTDAAAGHKLSLLYGWAAAIGFMLQIYFDFSGYSEMALGLARMVGIKLPMNFNSPLKAVSIIDFWARWHITLTRFLTAYVYNPMIMSGTRSRMAKGKRPIVGAKTTFGAFVQLGAIPTMTTMFLSGLWHGAGTQYLVWGILHGCFLIVNHAWRMWRPRFWRDNESYKRVMHPMGFVLTFIAVMVAMPFFRADTVPAAWNVVSGMFGLNGMELPEAIASRFEGLGAALSHIGVTFIPGHMTATIMTVSWIVILLAIALIPPNLLEVMREFEPAITMPGKTPSGRIDPLSGFARALNWQPAARWAFCTACLAAAGIFALNRASAFLYWQF